MNEHEIERIACAFGVLRPDWPVPSLRTLLRRPELANRPRRDVAVALAWVASESATVTPARVLENGPWWRAAAIEGGTRGHQHVARVYGLTEGDPREVCHICGQIREDCQRRAATNGHEFTSRADIRRAEQPGADWMRRRMTTDTAPQEDAMSSTHSTTKEPSR